jgi:hypothetical protein
MPLSYTCILLHGLFFMQFKNHLLTVTTPRFKGHKFGYRPQGIPNIGPLPPGAPDIDWTSVGLKDNTNSNEKFPPSILQFSGSQTGTGELLPPGNKEYEFKLTLYRPYDIYSFRVGTLDTFSNVAKDKPAKTNGKEHVKDNVIKSCGSGSSNPITLLVALVYERDMNCKLPTVLSFYAEHEMDCNMIDYKQVNPALVAAQGLFASPVDFDLEFKKVDPVAPVCPDHIGVYGVSRDDEFSACELLVHDCIQFGGPNPINCAQFGVNG